MSAFMKIKRLAYRLGYRPKPGSILYSPSLSLLWWYRDSARKERNGE